MQTYRIRGRYSPSHHSTAYDEVNVVIEAHTVDEALAAIEAQFGDHGWEFAGVEPVDADVVRERPSQ